MRKFGFRNWSKKRKVILSVAGIGILLVAGLMVKENIRHHRLAASMDSLAAHLQTAGFSDVTQSNGCGRGQGPYGPAERSCSMSVVIIEKTKGIDHADLALDKFKKNIIVTGGFKVSVPLPNSIIDSDSGLMHGFAAYTHTSTGTGCGVSFSYNEENFQTRMSIRCDDSSWFTKTFLSGW